MKIVFTGTMHLTRDKETERYERMGITVQRGVTKSTDILVKGEAPGRTKIQKAQDYGIKIMEEESFYQWLKDERPEFFL